MFRVGNSYDGAILKAHNPIRSEADYWIVACVCKRPVTVPTPKLEKWFHNGKPIGCSACRAKEKLFPPSDEETKFTTLWQRKAPGKYQRVALPALNMAEKIDEEELSRNPLPRSDGFRFDTTAPQNAPTPPIPIPPPSSAQEDTVPLNPDYQFKI